MSVTWSKWENQVKSSERWRARSIF